jgi:hypothetical protein
MLDGSLAWNDRSANKADTRRVEGSRGLSVWQLFALASEAARPFGLPLYECPRQESNLRPMV